jgi:hypothetical protein
MLYTFKETGLRKLACDMEAISGGKNWPWFKGEISETSGCNQQTS